MSFISNILSTTFDPELNISVGFAFCFWSYVFGHMGSGNSRLYHRQRHLISKRLSLPVHLLTGKSGVHLNPKIKSNKKNVRSDDNGIRSVRSVESWTCLEHNDSFSEFEEDVLLSTWPIIASDIVGNGCTVFRIAFNLFPDLEKFLPFIKFDEDSTPLNEQTRCHVASFMNVFDKAIRALNGNQDAFYQEMMLLGAKHAVVPGMKIEYFKVFKQAMLLTCENIMNEEFTEDVRSAWSHFLDTIIDLLSEGCLVFEEEEDKMFSSRENVSGSNHTDQNSGQSVRRRSGRPSVVNMSPEEMTQFYSHCRESF